MTVGPALVTVRTVRTTLRAFTTLRCTGLAATLMGWRFTWLTTAGRDASASWRAPPPMMAPPQAQAQSLAKAIRTDMFSPLFRTLIAAEVPGSQRLLLPRTQNKTLNTTRLTSISSVLSEFNPIIYK
jgi:hypothetical protein